MRHLRDSLRALHAHARARTAALTTFCDDCASVCTPACHQGSAREAQRRVLLRAGIFGR